VGALLEAASLRRAHIAAPPLSRVVCDRFAPRFVRHRLIQDEEAGAALLALPRQSPATWDTDRWIFGFILRCAAPSGSQWRVEQVFWTCPTRATGKV
jgi:hypothetical protein